MAAEPLVDVYGLLAGAFLVAGAVLVGLGLFARRTEPVPGESTKDAVRPMLALGLALLAIGVVFAAVSLAS